MRLARALALDPAVLLLEHPTAAVAPRDIAALGRRVRAVANRRRAAVVMLTADRTFAESVGGRLLYLDAATGRLDVRRKSGWFR